MVLIDTKMEGGKFDGKIVYTTTFVFGNLLTNKNGIHIGKAQPIHMSFRQGMPPEDFAAGLRALADHIDENVTPEPTKKLTVVGGDNKD